MPNKTLNWMKTTAPLYDQKNWVPIIKIKMLYKKCENRFMWDGQLFPLSISINWTPVKSSSNLDFANYFFQIKILDISMTAANPSLRFSLYRLQKKNEKQFGIASILRPILLLSSDLRHKGTLIREKCQKLPKYCCWMILDYQLFNLVPFFCYLDSKIFRFPSFVAVFKLTQGLK